MASICWLYFFSKFLEFLDTFFFVARKKFSHVSTLHVIHHSVMPISTWFGVKFTPGKENKLPVLTVVILVCILCRWTQHFLCIHKLLRSHHFVRVLRSLCYGTTNDGLSLAVEALHNGHSNGAVHRHLCALLSAALQQRVRLPSWIYVVDWLPCCTLLVPLL